MENGGEYVKLLRTATLTFPLPHQVNFHRVGGHTAARALTGPGKEHKSLQHNTISLKNIKLTLSHFIPFPHFSGHKKAVDINTLNKFNFLNRWKADRMWPKTSHNQLLDGG